MEVAGSLTRFTFGRGPKFILYGLMILALILGSVSILAHQAIWAVNGAVGETAYSAECTPNDSTTHHRFDVSIRFGTKSFVQSVVGCKDPKSVARWILELIQDHITDIGITSTVAAQIASQVMGRLEAMPK